MCTTPGFGRSSLLLLFVPAYNSDHENSSQLVNPDAPGQPAFISGYRWGRDYHTLVLPPNKTFPCNEDHFEGEASIPAAKGHSTCRKALNSAKRAKEDAETRHCKRRKNKQYETLESYPSLITWRLRQHGGRFGSNHILQTSVPAGFESKVTKSTDNKSLNIKDSSSDERRTKRAVGAEHQHRGSAGRTSDQNAENL